MPDSYLDDDSLPTVKNGRLSKPYPIRSKGDVNRALVLPPPAPEPAARTTEQRAGSRFTRDKRPKGFAPPAESEQPQGGFDYVRKRRNLQKQLGVRGPARRSASRVSRA